MASYRYYKEKVSTEERQAAAAAGRYRLTCASGVKKRGLCISSSNGPEYLGDIGLGRLCSILGSLLPELVSATAAEVEFRRTRGTSALGGAVVNAGRVADTAEV